MQKATRKNEHDIIKKSKRRKEKRPWLKRGIKNREYEAPCLEFVIVLSTTPPLPINGYNNFLN